MVFRRRMRSSLNLRWAARRRTTACSRRPSAAADTALTRLFHRPLRGLRRVAHTEISVGRRATREGVLEGYLRRARTVARCFHHAHRHLIAIEGEMREAPGQAARPERFELRIRLELLTNEGAVDRPHPGRAARDDLRQSRQ